MSIFSFTCNKSYYYFLIFWILDLSIFIVRSYYLNLEAINIEFKITNEYINICCLNLADLLA